MEDEEEDDFWDDWSFAEHLMDDELNQGGDMNSSDTRKPFLITSNPFQIKFFVFVFRGIFLNYN